MDRRRRQALAETGAITAEFAVALPAVIAVLVIGCGALATQVQQLKLQSQAAVITSALASGETAESARKWLSAQSSPGNPPPTIHQAIDQGILCITLIQGLRVGITLPSFNIEAKSCHWMGEEVPHE